MDNGSKILNCRFKNKIKALAFILFFVCAKTVFAQVVINEIMYDAEGADSDREWVELYNNGDSEVDLTGWKFNDGSSHVLNEPPKNGGIGSLVLPANGYAILVNNAENFLIERLGFSGTVIDTVMSLNNTTDTLSLIDTSKVEVVSVTYQKEMGANGDGNSLQMINGVFVVGTPTPGEQNSEEQIIIPSNEESFQEDAPQESNVISWPTEPQIYANAGADKSSVSIFQSLNYTQMRSGICC